MPTLYKFQEQAIDDLVNGKHFAILQTGAGKSAVGLNWAQAIQARTGKTKLLVITTASKRDSCFVAGEKVMTTNGEKNIEDVMAGEKVLSYNGDTVEYKPVLRTIKQESEEQLYRISFGKCGIIGTENHPFYIGGGKYKPLKELKEGDNIYVYTETKGRGTKKTQRGNGKILQCLPKPVLFKLWKENARTNETAEGSVLGKRNTLLFERLFKAGTERRGIKSERQGIRRQVSKWNTLFMVRKENRTNDIDNAKHIQAEWKNILFGGMWEKGEGSESEKNMGGSTKKERVYTEYSSQEGASICRETDPYTSPSKSIIRGDRRGDGICSALWRYLCANRLGVPGGENGDRDRRPEPQEPIQKVYRREKRQGIRRVRVESVEILGHNDSGTNTVYCLEVKDNHNFFVNGALVHNCDFEREIEIFTPTLSSSLSTLSVISWHGLDKWKRQHLGELAEWIYIFDEAKCQAGVSSQMGRAFLNITRATSDWTLYTATPGDTWIKFYPYFQATGKTRNKTQFMYDYAIVQTYKGYPEITGYRRVDELKRFWSEISTAPDTSQMNKELPPETHKTITFKPSTTYFKTLKTRKVERDGEEVMLDTAGALTSELRRQCFTKQKQQWVSDFVENIGTNAILFYNFTQTGDLLQEIVEKALKQYKGARVWRIDGRHHEIPTAETIGKYDIILCQWQAGAEGLNAQFCHLWVGVEMTYSYSTALQARGRIKRIGQTQPMFYYYLKTENTIESAVYKALKTKSDFADDVWLEAQGIELTKGDQNDT